MQIFSLYDNHQRHPYSLDKKWKRSSFFVGKKTLAVVGLEPGPIWWRAVTLTTGLTGNTSSLSKKLSSLQCCHTILLF